MDAIPVTLIVKAPNQLQDQTIQCELSWTIKRLKGYLSEVYSCQPEEQKLIYSGRLLQDAFVLKDILRQYEGQDTHTVHLVYTPKITKNESDLTSKMSSSATADDSRNPSTSSNATTPSVASTSRSHVPDAFNSDSGLRHRNVSTTAPADPAANQNTMPQPNFVLPQSPTFNFPTVWDQQATAAYQSWIQQQYQQYWSQYMAYYAATAAAAAASSQGANNLFAMPLHHHQQPFFASSQAAAADGAAASSNSTESPNNNNNQPNNDELRAVDPAPRFPVIVHEPEGENRDWLDCANLICRFIILGAMIYFYSSPIRCLIVITVGLALYIYTNRQQMRRLMLPVVQLPPAHPQQPIADAQPRDQANDEPPALVAGPANNNQNNNEAANGADRNNNTSEVANRNNNNNDDAVEQLLVPAVDATQRQDQNNRTSVLTFLRTLVGSFIASLVPEPPAH